MFSLQATWDLRMFVSNADPLPLDLAWLGLQCAKPFTFGKHTFNGAPNNAMYFLSVLAVYFFLWAKLLSRFKMLYMTSYPRTPVDGVASVYQETLRCFVTTFV